MDTYEHSILDLLGSRGYTPLTDKQLAQKLRVQPEHMKDFQKLIQKMEEDGSILFTKKGKIMLPREAGFVAGKYSSTDRGFGFVIPDEDLGGDIFIPARFYAGAMHGDQVLAKITERKTGDGRRMEGEIVRVLKRNTTTLIGRFERSRTHGFVVPDNRRYCDDIYISSKCMGDAQEGDKVVVELSRYSDGRRNPEGKVVAILGNALSKDANYMGILYDHNIREAFPDDVMEQVRSIPQNVREEDIEGRMDLRKETIFTIDGADAKDFDDAISICKDEQGRYHLGVHIADVSYYVTEGSPLDREAFRRGTSVYFVDKVVPMLPVELSNGICSLNPRVDRLAFSCIMTIDGKGRVLDYQLGRSVIRSCERLIYSDVTKVIERTDAMLMKRYEHLVGKFDLMKELADILYAMRERRGAINFDFPEAKILVDEKGDPTDVILRERGVADHIIEEFMLAANECVAQHVCMLEKPCIYRIHEKPSEEKTQNFLKMARVLGIRVKTVQGELTPMVLQRVLGQMEGRKEERMVSTSMLRSMMKAQYYQENLGHFGLAAKYYCHFTSPIRRYPDLGVHRILAEILQGEMTENRERQLKAFSIEASEQSSEMELNAVDAERDIEDLYKCIYMSKYVGSVFEGVISSVTRFGIFVELPNTIEGLVKMDELDDDYYEYVEEKLCLIGTRTGRKYCIGDPIRVKLARSDMITREIDFALADNEEEADEL